jgi:hypothetical protein
MARSGHGVTTKLTSAWCAIYESVRAGKWRIRHKNDLGTPNFHYRHALMFAGSSGSTGHCPRTRTLTSCVMNLRAASFSVLCDVL